MKTALFSLVLIAGASSNSHAIEQKETSDVREVTVFLCGAQVNRFASFTVPQGETEIVFTGISPLLKRESLQAGTKADVTILSVYYETKLTEKVQDKAKLKNLETEQNALMRKLNRLYATLHVWQTQEDMITNLSQVQHTIKDCKVEDVVRAKEVIAKELEGIMIKRIDTQEEVNTVTMQLNELAQQISAFGVIYETIEPRIVVKVKSDKEQKVAMDLSYFVPAASWYPSYNLRVDNLAEPLTIDYQANVTQQTGEDWTNVKLTLSTNDPNLTGIKPELTPWYLVLNQRNDRPDNNNLNRYTPGEITQISGRLTDQYGDPLPFANVRIPGSTIGTITDGDGFYQLNLPYGTTQVQFSYVGYNDVVIYVSTSVQNVVLSERYLSLEEVTVIEDMEYDQRAGEGYDESGVYQEAPIGLAYTITGGTTTRSEIEQNLKGKRDELQKQAIYGPTQSVPVEVEKHENVVSAEFKIKEAYTIMSDTKQYTVLIDEIEHKAHYQYYCAPKLDPDAFLTAQLTGWEDLNLLEGQANIFFEGTYVGTSILDAKFVGDTMDISLGRDQRIVVEREKEKEFSKNKVIGDEAVKSVKWNISVKNSKGQAISLILEDQFPLTSDAEIKIERDDVTKAIVSEETGFITWDLKIGAGKMEELGFMYKVTYPSGNVVYLD